MWTLRVEYQRAGRGWYVVAWAIGQATVTWGPFATQAAAEGHRRQLLATDATTSA